uniref:Putative secreted protein n=1 Tax=Ixodes ricinus TaxID=34613 RepID=A0A6B0U6G7_IXORI
MCLAPALLLGRGILASAVRQVTMKQSIGSLSLQCPSRVCSGFRRLSGCGVRYGGTGVCRTHLCSCSATRIVEGNCVRAIPLWCATRRIVKSRPLRPTLLS